MTRPVAFAVEDCRRFLAATIGRAADERVQAAIDLARPVGDAAVDLGCGPGNETVALLRAGFRTIAIDAFAEAIQATVAQARRAGVTDRLLTHVARLEDVRLAEGAFALAISRFALPFVAATAFPTVWSGMRHSLLPGGIFWGQLFGPHDSDVVERPRGTMNAHSSEELRELLVGFEPISIEEVERDGTTATGRAKHWHVHHLLLRRSRDGADQR